MRSLFGRSLRGGMMAGVLALASTFGCEVYRGKLYLAGTVPGLPVLQECLPSEKGAGSTLRIRVLDLESNPFPQVSVRLKELHSGHVVLKTTGQCGCVEVAPEPGKWRIDVSLPGFRPLRYTADVSEDQSCTLTFHLERPFEGEDEPEPNGLLRAPYGATAASRRTRIRPDAGSQT